MTPDELSKALRSERMQLRAVARCARRALRQDPMNRTAVQCLKEARGKLFLLRKTREKHGLPSWLKY